MANTVNAPVPEGFETIEQFATRHGVQAREIKKLTRLRDPNRRVPHKVDEHGRYLVPIKEADVFLARRIATARQPANDPGTKLVLATLSMERYADRLEAGGWHKSAAAMRRVVLEIREEVEESRNGSN